MLYVLFLIELGVVRLSPNNFWHTVTDVLKTIKWALGHKMGLF